MYVQLIRFHCTASIAKNQSFLVRGGARFDVLVGAGNTRAGRGTQRTAKSRNRLPKQTSPQREISYADADGGRCRTALLHSSTLSCQDC